MVKNINKYTGLEPWTRSGLNQQPAADRQTIWSVTVSSLSPGVSVISGRNDHQPADSQQSPGSQQSRLLVQPDRVSFHFHTQAVLDPTFLRERTVIKHCDWSREGILALSLAVLQVKSKQWLWVSDNGKYQEHVERVQYWFSLYCKRTAPLHTKFQL